LVSGKGAGKLVEAGRRRIGSSQTGSLTNCRLSATVAYKAQLIEKPREQHGLD
jgi:hypothetical protein